MSTPIFAVSPASASTPGNKRASEVNDDHDTPTKKQRQRAIALHDHREVLTEASAAIRRTAPGNTGVPAAPTSWPTPRRTLEAIDDPLSTGQSRHITALNTSSEVIHQPIITPPPATSGNSTSRPDNPFITPAMRRTSATEVSHTTADRCQWKELSKTDPTPESILSSSTTTPATSSNSTATEESITMLRPCQWATKEDWVERKGLITELYSQNSLRDVMRIMESQYGFKATYAFVGTVFGIFADQTKARMYKSRIAIWGLDKKCKETEMKAIARMVMERGSIGKCSAVRVRGRNVELHDVVRYWRRKGATLEEVNARPEGPTTLESTGWNMLPGNVECATTPPTSLRTPEVFALPENIFTVLRNYHLSTSETGVERSDSQMRITIPIPDVVYRINKFHFECWLACQLFDIGSPSEAGHHLLLASDSIKTTVLAEHPQNFTSYLRVIVDIRKWGRHEVGTLLLRYASGMGEVLLSRNHPLSLVCGWLASLDKIDIPGYGQSVFDSVRETCESFKETLGQLYRSSTETRLRYPETTIDNAVPHSRATLSALLGEYGDMSTHNQSPLRSARTALAHFYLGWENCPEVEEAAQVLIANKVPGDLRLEALDGLADALYSLDEMATAEHRLREAIKLASAIWAAATQTTLLRLEDWLAKNKSEAAPKSSGE